MTSLRFDTYDWPGGREAMLRFGPDTGPIVIAALPLFEEANRTRQFTCTILRALADHGIGSLLSDFPGTGESVVTTLDTKLSEQRRAYRALTQQLGVHSYALSIRSGALLDTDADLAGRWHLAPHTGSDLVRDLERTRAAASKSAREGEYAGNRLSPEMLAELQDAVPFEGGRYRVVRLNTDPRTADATYAGAPLWRRSEPSNDIAFAQQLAADISHWIASCEG
ncbi:hypothetical protein [Sphingomonas faeni]|uniref:hypothetical protein n=1 Tax=Sphingomonas faeni TaxID=185950 RepID=UPI0024133B53|nr:hypothetical protein [Sphingomonas faeni]